MLRFLLLGLLALHVPALGLAQTEPPPLLGHVEGKTYTAPNGAFRITIPVLPELGGVVADSENVVVFQDQYSVHIIIASFAQDATQRWEFSTRGLKDYLGYFFYNFVLPDYQRTYKDVSIETADFAPQLLDGSLLVYALLPGGTMFRHRLVEPSPDAPVPIAKRGNMIFVRNGFVYVISLELAERVTEGRLYRLSPNEENEVIRNRLADVIHNMEFARAAGRAP